MLSYYFILLKLALNTMPYAYYAGCVQMVWAGAGVPAGSAAAGAAFEVRLWPVLALL